MNIKKNQMNKNSNIGFESLFSKTKIGHFQILNMNNILISITLFFNLTLENSNKRAIYIKYEMATILFLGINSYILIMLKVK